MHLARGFAMGAADIVPGVSGGTVALILGIYERLLHSVRSGARSLGRLVAADRKGFILHLRTIEWAFIVPLLAGMFIAVVTLSAIIDTLLRDEPELMAGCFFGLVLASTVITWRLLAKRGTLRMFLLLVAAAVTFLALGLRSEASATPSPVAFFAAGAVAICAMILPGISGSFLLLMLGMYGHFIEAVHARVVTQLGAFLLGAVIGLSLFSSALGWLLDRYKDTVLALLVGLMLGSLRVLWPWPNGVGEIDDSAHHVDGTLIELPQTLATAWPPILAMVLATAAVFWADRRAVND